MNAAVAANSANLEICHRHATILRLFTEFVLMSARANPQRTWRPAAVRVPDLPATPDPGHYGWYTDDTAKGGRSRNTRLSSRAPLCLLTPSG